MKALIVAAMLVLTPSGAIAGTLHCSFTEPFFSIDFDSATGIVTRTSPDDADPETGAIEPKIIAEGASIARVEAWRDFPTLRLEAEGNLIIEVRITGQGSDGMSDFVFPWEGQHGPFVGGCETGMAPAYNSYDVFEDLGIVD